MENIFITITGVNHYFGMKPFIMVPDVILAGDLNIYRSSIVDGRIMSYLLNHIVNDQIARVAQGTRFLKRNGLQQVKFYEIRHTFAVRAIEIPEFDVKSLSEILGHKNVSFTLNVYGSANMQQKVKCMNLLNDLL